MNLSQSKILTVLLKHLPDLELVYVFGSYANNTMTAKSDIDIAVMLPKPFACVERFNTAQLIANDLNINIDLVDLHTCSTVLQKQIIEKGILLYGEGAEVFEMKVMSMYQHLNEERSALLNSAGF